MLNPSDCCNRHINCTAHMRMKLSRSQSFVDVRTAAEPTYNFRVIWRRWLPQSTILMIVWTLDDWTDGWHQRGRVLQRLHSVTYVPIHRHNLWVWSWNENWGLRLKLYMYVENIYQTKKIKVLCTKKLTTKTKIPKLIIRTKTSNKKQATVS